MQDIVLEINQNTTHRLRKQGVLHTTNIHLHRAGGTIMVYLKIKRLIDIILSGIGLIILSPVFLVLIIAIKVDSP